MNFLINALKNTKEFLSVQKALKPNCTVCATGVTGINKANMINTLCHLENVRAFCVAGDEQEAQSLCNDLCFMGKKAYVYTVKDFSFRDIEGKSMDYEHQRLNVLLKILDDDYDVIITCIDALMQYTIPPEVLKKSVLKLKVGQCVELENCINTLTLMGYKRFDQVDGQGQFAVRGGILDFFMPDGKNPVRVEFWGDEITDINYFEVESQRRVEKAEEIILTPSTEILVEDNQALADTIIKKANLLRGKAAPKAREILFREADKIMNNLHLGNMDKFIPVIYKKPATLLDYFEEGSLVFLSEYQKIKDRAKSTEFMQKEALAEFFEEGVLCRGFDTYSITYKDTLEFFESQRMVCLENFAHGSFDFKLTELLNFNFRQLPLWNGSISVMSEDLEGLDLKNSSVVILSGTEKSAKYTADALKEKGFNAVFVNDTDNLQKGIIYVLPGALSCGFEYPSVKFTLFSHGFSNAPQKAKKRKTPKNAKEVYSLSDLSIGDYVVHTTHGIGVFGGIKKIDVHGVIKDYIKIEYAKQDVLYVPVTQLDLVAKYIGPRENSTVKLSRLGGADWTKAKARVKSSVKDMAKELIALYSQRMQAKGYAFSEDNEWQHDFESRFEFEETQDQLRCCSEIKSDMERVAPMDRLLCGDVGFGKTEVALRAAFKCVSDSKQCALLCPTTILAWQHYQTLTRRFEDYPVRIELLSRFRTPKQQKEILKKLKHGEIDIVVGTHRLVQKDVEFHDLGLAIIDEEQRFGVAHKERFKEVCKNVDVLTLSATPIPRTLNMAMSGIRDMSVLEEAPRNRHPVQTYVLEHDTGIINEAIRKEIRRGGQVFYLHNKVETILDKASKLQNMLPEAKIAVAHGKMNEKELSDVWKNMLNQDVNLLVCTTIIETGVDLPNANTLIIENADCMGLSQLHQIRGRVGRSTRRAYAYFTFHRGKVLSDISQKRLTAIREFTEFGSGFKIAMRDLELRGAGNILGAQQHGHMEDVGYDMYLKLLGEAVSEEKGEVPDNQDIECLIDVAVQAHIPENYIYNLSQRLDIYRRIADIRTNEDSADVKDELIDRFGKIPQAVLGLIDIAEIRNKAFNAGIYEIKQNEATILLYVKDIKSQVVSELLVKFKGKCMINAGNKPYVAVKFEKYIPPLDALKEIFEVK